MTDIDQLHRYLKGHRGKLHIQGHVFKKWKPRYFVLEKKKVKYYADEQMGLVNGEYALERDTQIYDVPGESEGRKHLFYLCGKNPASENDILFVSANSEKDKREWIEALSDAIHDGFKQINQPELWKTSFYPSIDLNLQYTQANVSVENGNILKPSYVVAHPTVTYKLPSNCSSTDKFSLVMMDFDAVGSAESPAEQSQNRAYLHWGIVNIQGSDISTGDELAHYVPPAPAYNSGLHRFFFLLFKHTSVFSAVQRNETTELFLKRDAFDYHKWTKILNFGDPVAINGFYSGWEDYCDTLHTLLNYSPPEAYRSPKQDQAHLILAEEMKVEKAKNDLYRDLTLSDIFPASVDFSVKAAHKTIGLTISYGEITARDGCILTPKEVYRAPRVAYEPPTPPVDDCNYYTLIMCDPDAPSRVNHSMREYIHWVVVNIPGSDISAGIELLPYVGAAPAYSSGLHRYVFSLYKQTSVLSAKVCDTGKKHFSERKGILSHDWVSHNRNAIVATPVGVEAFLSEWDDSVDALHATLGFMPPPQYRSPAQVLFAHNEQEKQDAATRLAAEKEKLLARQAQEENERILKLLAAEQAFKSKLETLPTTITVESSSTAPGESPFDEPRAVTPSGAGGSNGFTSAGSGSGTQRAHLQAQSAPPVSAAAPVAATYVAAVSVAPQSPKSYQPAGSEQPFTESYNPSAAPGQPVATFTTTTTHQLPPQVTVNVTSAPPTQQQTVQQTTTSTTASQQPPQQAASASAAAAAPTSPAPVSVSALVKKYSLANMNAAVAAESPAPVTTTTTQVVQQQQTTYSSTPQLVSSTTTTQQQRLVRQESTQNTSTTTSQSTVEEPHHIHHHAQSTQQSAHHHHHSGHKQEEVATTSTITQIVADQQQILRNQQEQIAMQQEQQRILLQQQQQILQQQQFAQQQALLKAQEEALLAARTAPAMEAGPLQRKYSANPDSPSMSHVSKRLTGSGDTPSPSLRTRSQSPDVLEARSQSPQSILKEGGEVRGLAKKISFRADVDTFLMADESNSQQQQQQQKKKTSPLPPMAPPASPTASNASSAGAGGMAVPSLSVNTSMPPPQPKFLQRNASVQNMGANKDQKKGGIQRSPSVANMYNQSPNGGIPAFSPTGSGKPPTQRSTSPGNSRRGPTITSSGMDVLDDLISYTPPGGISNSRSNDLNINTASYDDDNGSIGSAKRGGGSGGGSGQPMMRTQSMYSTSSEKKQSLFGVQGTSITADSPRNQRKSMDLNSSGSGSNRHSSRDHGNAEMRARIAAATNVNELCDIFGITSTSVFEGETMKKKFSKDFMFKDSFLWIDPLSKSIHWGKSVADKMIPKNQKHLLLDRINSSSADVKPSGEMKGILKSVEFSGSNILITIESGELLEMKLSPDGYPPSAKRATDWVKVIRSFSDSLY